MVADLIASSKLWIGDGYRAKNSELDSAGIPFARAGDINDGFYFTSGDHLPEEDAWKAGNKLSEAGDVVFTSKGTVGRFGFVTEEIQRFVYSPQLCFWRSLDYGAIYPRFLFYWIQGKEFYRQYKSVSQKTDMAEYVSLSDQRSMEITLPELSSQKAIAHILGTLDNKIELNRKTNETLEAMAKALFKSWFVDFDPVRAKAEGRPTGLPAEISDLFPDSFEDSELGEIPSGWEPRTIREWGITECGKTPSTHNQEFYGNNYMFVTIPDLHNGFHIVSSGKQLSELGADSQRKKLLPPGSVMVSCIATPGLVGVAKEACFTNQQINSIIPNSKEASWFLALAMIENRDLLLSLGGGGSVFFNLSKGRFDEIEILAPSEDLISAFNGVVSALMDRCFATKQEIIALTNVRDAILPKLISGEIRIPDAEKMLEEVDI